MDNYGKAAGRNKPGHNLEENAGRGKRLPRQSILGLLEGGMRSQEENGKRGQRRSKEAWGWAIKDLASHEKDSDGILSIMGIYKSVVRVWRLRVEAGTH